jgi:hypothetical protein
MWRTSSGATRVLNGNGQGWQAIDTAPPNESIIVFTARWGPIIAELSTEFSEWMSRMQCPVSLKEDDEQPTHWMPLPTAPDSQEPSGSDQALSADGG